MSFLLSWTALSEGRAEPSILRAQTQATLTWEDASPAKSGIDGCAVAPEGPAARPVPPSESHQPLPQADP